MKEKKRAVITGLGILTSAGIGKEIFWENSLKEKSYITAYPDFKNFPLKTRLVGSIAGFEPGDFFITENELARLGRPMQLAIAGTVQAISDAGLKFISVDRERVGICIGNAVADAGFIEQQYLAIRSLWESGNTEPANLYSHVDENLYFKSLFSNISTEIAARFGIMGPVLTMVTGCTAGIDAIGCGFEMIRSGEADMVIAGAAEAPLTLLTMAALNAIDSAPKIPFLPGKSPLYDHDASDLNSFVLAEGCGICLLEEWEHARKRNAHIYAEMAGFSSTNSLMPMTELKRDGEQLAQAITGVLNNAGIKPGQVGYISTPGSLIPSINLDETNAYKKIFGNLNHKLLISSTKPIIGHSMGAASAIEIVHGCLALEWGIVPSPVNLAPPLLHASHVPGNSRNFIPGKPQKKQIDFILTHATDISGIYSALILRRPGLESVRVPNTPSAPGARNDGTTGADSPGNKRRIY